MKKYILFIFIFIIFLCSCKDNILDINNNPKKEDEKIILKQDYVEVVEKFINLRDFVINENFSVSYENNTFSSNESLLFKLHNGLNSFTIELGEESKKFDVYLLKDIKVNILNYDGTVKKSLIYKENTILNEDDLVEFHPEQTYKKWLGFDIEFPLKLTLDIDLKSNFEYESFDVTFNYNDNSIVKSIKAYSLFEFPLIDSSEYELLGWYCNDIKYFDGDLFIPENGLEFSAKLYKKTYTLTYVYNNTKKQVNLSYQEKIDSFIPTIKGYKFIKWENNGKEFNDTVYNYKESITLNAVFEKINYKINYYDNTTLLNEVNINYLDNILEYTPTKEGYKFIYWLYNGKEFNTTIFDFETDIKLVALWEEKITKIDLNLNTLIGSCNKTCSVLDDGTVVLPTISKEGYKFVGWYFDPEYINKVTKIDANTYNFSSLYALLEPTSESYIGFIPFTCFNLQESPYEDGCLYDNSHNPTATLYWHKIGIKEINSKYYISGVAASGKALSLLGNRDYVFLAYSSYALIDKVKSMDIKNDYIVEFAVDVKNLSNGYIFDVMYIYKNTITPIENQDYTNVISHLDSLYNDVNEVNSNINLIKNYDGYNIEWFSNSRMTISDNGEYNLPAVDRNVTLTAYINNTEVYSFSFFVKGVKEKSNAISVGYIYTPYNITQTGMNCVDLIICAFLDIDENGNFVNETSITNKMNTYIFDKAKIAGTKVSVSINQDSSGIFDKMIENDEALTNFADNVLEFVKKNHLDGIDIDWETPVESKKTNFTKLMKTLYEKLKAYDSSIIITAAIGGGMWQPPRYDLANSKNYMDYINMMTYSMVSNSGYFSGPLYKSNHGKTLVSCSIEESVEIYHQYGIPNSMILVGVPFYGTKQTETGGPGSGKGSGGSVWLDKAFADYPLSNTMKEYFDRECCVTYRYDDTSKVMICYQDEKTIQLKCDYINSLGLGGIMYWQYGQDINDNLSLLIDKYIRK